MEVCWRLFFVERLQRYIKILNIMRKSEVFEHVLRVIEQETEINRDLILSSRKNAEIVDARYILVYSLYCKGFYFKEIAQLLRLTRQAVNQIITKMDIHCSKGGKMFETNLNRICNMLEIKCLRRV